MATGWTRGDGEGKGIRAAEEGRIPPSASGQTPLVHTLRRVEGLHVFRGVLQDEIGRSFLNLLSILAVEGRAGDRDAIIASYAQLFSLLAGEVELRKEPTVGDPWQNHLLDRLLSDENPFSLKAQRASFDTMGPSLIEACRHDLRVLRKLFDLDEAGVFDLLRERLGDDIRDLVPWDALRPACSDAESAGGTVVEIKRKFASEARWEGLLEALARHFATAGAGIYATFRAFRWVKRDGVGQLEGVAHPDPISLDELVEYDLERSLLLRNTEQFVEGFPANNVLLYGDRGTGKSSTVKALLQQFGDRGLRLVEVPKSLLGDFPRILAMVRGRRERFVMFVDDLSFDERETAYKELKAALEGSVEARPENVVVYATSNRRHLVQERFSDRVGGDGEIRGWDTHQEKLSLADRFGITLVFITPDQDRYLRIVESLARQRGLEINGASLRSRAVEWASQQGGFSGRAARQLVDHLTGEFGMAAPR